jgi:hypothetical protein
MEPEMTNPTTINTAARYLASLAHLFVDCHMMRPTLQASIDRQTQILTEA